MFNKKSELRYSKEPFRNVYVCIYKKTGNLKRIYKTY